MTALNRCTRGHACCVTLAELDAGHDHDDRPPATCVACLVLTIPVAVHGAVADTADARHPGSAPLEVRIAGGGPVVDALVELADVPLRELMGLPLYLDDRLPPDVVELRLADGTTVRLELGPPAT